MIGLGLPRGFFVTLKNFVRPAVTEQYPDRHVGLLGAAKEAGMKTVQLVRDESIAPADGHQQVKSFDEIQL